MALGEEIYNDLKAKGIEVILDDRTERAGVNLKTQSLWGFQFESM